MPLDSTAMPSRVPVSCETCGVTFTAWRNDVRGGNARFCGRPCFQVARRITRQAQQEAMPPTGQRTCETCGAVFRRKPSDPTRSCSMACRSRRMSLGCREDIRYNDGGLTAEIPLYARGGVITGYTLIDRSDAEWASQYRWYLDAYGYVRRDQMIDNQRQHILMHRELLGLVHGDGLTGDHIRLMKTDNRRSELRIIQRAEQQQNLPSQRGSSSKYRGVSWQSKIKKWRATVTHQSKTHNLGTFVSEEAAAEAAREARLRLMPYAVD